MKTWLLGIAVLSIAVAHCIFVYSESKAVGGEESMEAFREIDMAFWHVSGDEDQTLRITALSKDRPNQEVAVEVLSLPLVSRAGGLALYRKGILAEDQVRVLEEVLKEADPATLRGTYDFQGSTTAEHPGWLKGSFTSTDGGTRRFNTLLNVYSEGAIKRSGVAEAGRILRLVKAVRDYEAFSVEAEVGGLAEKRFRSRIAENYASCPTALRPFLAKGLVLIGEFSETLLQDPDPSVRIYTLWGLVETSPQQARQYLQRALQDTDPSVREFAQGQIDLLR